MKSLISLLLIFLSMFNAPAQSTDKFNGVFSMQNPALVLVLKSTGNAVSGYLADVNNAYRVEGALSGEDVLTLNTLINGENNKSYASLDAAGNLLLTDDVLDMIYFTRSLENVDSVLAAIDQALKQMAGSTADVDKKPATVMDAAAKKYANKKFLHLYTGNGMTEKWAYYLFDDGRFYFRSEASYASGNAFNDFSAALSSKDAGTWQIKGNGTSEELHLRWNTGEQRQLVITKTSKGYRLGNTDYFLVGLEEYE
jgi:hypothetical protein